MHLLISLLFLFHPAVLKSGPSIHAAYNCVLKRSLLPTTINIFLQMVEVPDAPKVISLGIRFYFSRTPHKCCRAMVRAGSGNGILSVEVEETVVPLCA